eukprot:256286-Chlamydomonas_euryale.AAC.1
MKLQGLSETLQRLAPDKDAVARARQQWSDYQLGHASGRFACSNTQMWSAARTMQPHTVLPRSFGDLVWGFKSP